MRVRLATRGACAVDEANGQRRSRATDNVTAKLIGRIELSRWIAVKALMKRARRRLRLDLVCLRQRHMTRERKHTELTKDSWHTRTVNRVRLRLDCARLPGRDRRVLYLFAHSLVSISRRRGRLLHRCYAATSDGGDFVVIVVS